MIAVKAIRQKTVVEQALLEFRKLVESSSLESGAKLPPEDELASDFGISKQSVREAIKVFDYLGITSTEPGRGTFVCKTSDIASKIFIWAIILGDIDTDELVSVREMLEKKGVRDITQCVASDPERATTIVSTLRTHLSQLQQAAYSGNEEQRVEADYRFHETIISGTGNKLFVNLYGTFQYYMKGVIQRTQVITTNPEDLVRYHQKIVDAIEKGDEEKALAALSAHMKAACWERSVEPVETIEV